MGIKSKGFRHPGIHHDIIVKLVTEKQLAKILKDPNCLACYFEDNVEILIIKSLPEQKKLQAFCHELGHHMEFELSDVNDEEMRCDLKGSFLQRFADTWETTKKNLKNKSKKND